ncbi:MAG: hypothetical protein JOZ90_11010 [Alphaproteobacteria bacterium]|nr:hypothetical protein [Alphaproteobacteria bacterium]MBV9371012.1 hypothetical protein [Alphaproteobacteria bacterium]MBV9901615.1 hypothetical protein [Alphaproteobacteria bacterium]
MAQQARGEASAPTAELAVASAASRQQVQAIMRDLHRFDPYLQFASPEEEAEYRRREAERRADVEREQAKGTSQGELNASAVALGQMADAAAHGADSNPEFQHRFDELAATHARLRDSMRRDGLSTDEADARVKAEAAALLRRRSGSAEEAATLADSGDPLRLLAREMEARRTVQATAPNAPETSTASSELEDAIAALRAAGATPTLAVAEIGSPSASAAASGPAKSTGRG